MENGHETLASPTTASAEKAVPSGGAAGEEVTVTDAVHPAMSYAVVAANAEIEDLLTKLELEEQLASVSQENKILAAKNKILAAKAHHLEGLLSQARDDVFIAEQAAASSEEKGASLSAEVRRLQRSLKHKNLECEMDERQRGALAAEVEAVRQARLKFEKAIEALKASAATATVEREAAPAAGVPKGKQIDREGMAGAVAVIVAAFLAIFYLLLKLDYDRRSALKFHF